MKDDHLASKVLVWLPVYNEASHLAETLRSVCSQTYRNIDILVSLNHCTDKSKEIAEEFAGIDSRICLIEPPSFMTSLEHAQWIRSYIIQNQSHPDYIIHIGGHDIINEDYISTLVKFLDDHSEYSLAYAEEAYAIDANGSRLFRWDAQPETCRVGDFWSAFYMLTGLQHNIPAFGAMRYGIWASEELGDHCYAIDHFLVAKYALQGRIRAVEGVTIELRYIQTSNELYRSKHLGNSYSTVDDFLKQLSHLKKMVDGSGGRHSDTNILLGACSALYLLRYKGQFRTQTEMNDLLSSDIGLRDALEGIKTFGARVSELVETKTDIHKENMGKRHELSARLVNLNNLVNSAAC